MAVGQTMTDDRDWREWAYLQASNWPECIPHMGPKREYGPAPWGTDDSDGDYTKSHPAAASIGNYYLGHVCPFCGVPIHAKDDQVITQYGVEGTVWDIEAARDGYLRAAAYHRTCHYKIKHRKNSTLDMWVDA